MQYLDHFIIGVSSVLEQGSGDIKTYNEAYFIEKERDRYERKSRLGVIVAMPMVYREINYMPIDPGLPTPRLFIGHDDIQKKVNEGYQWSNTQYHPSSRDQIFEYITIADYGRMITVKAGDPIYFHPSVTEPENWIGDKDGLRLYRATVTELICSGDTPQGGHIIVAPIVKENTSDGLILGFDDVDEAMMGVVKYSRTGSGFKPGMRVYFQENSNWDFWMNGERYYAMLEENIVLKEAV